jgi:hypothetical protein
VLPRKAAAGAERVIRAGARLSPTLGLAGRQLAAGIGGQSPAHYYFCCSAGKEILEPRGSLTDGEAPLCLFWAGQAAYGIAQERLP